MDLRPRPCCNVISALAPFVGFVCGLVAFGLQGGHPMSAAKTGLMTWGAFLALGFIFACITIIRRERLWGITVLGMVLNAPCVLIYVMAPWDMPF